MKQPLSPPGTIITDDYKKRVRKLHRYNKALTLGPVGKIGLESHPLDKEHDEAQRCLCIAVGSYMRLCDRYPLVK